MTLTDNKHTDDRYCNRYTEFKESAIRNLLVDVKKMKIRDKIISDEYPQEELARMSKKELETIRQNIEKNIDVNSESSLKILSQLQSRAINAHTEQRRVKNE